METQRTISRFRFEFAVLAGTVILSVGEGAFAVLIERRMGLGRGTLGRVVSGLAFLNLVLVRQAVDRLLKAVGLSRSGRMTEGRRPASAVSEFVPGEAIEVRCRSTLSNGLALTCLAMAAVVFLLSEVVIPKAHQTGREALPALYGMFLGLGALCYLLRYIKVIRIDADGVTAHRNGYSILPTKIPWDQVASCDLVAIRDTFGKIVVTYPVMKDVAGKDLFSGLMQGFAAASSEDQQRVLHSLKQRFPKLDIDPWEL
jgi:hypothetical protein